MPMFQKSARYYELLYSFKDYEAAATALHDRIRKLAPTSTTLLDVGCGTGTHIRYLRQWYHCEGLDVDENILEAARRQDPEIPWHQADMASFRLARTFDVVTCLFSAIGYVRTAERMRSSLRHMAIHLNPGGVLLLEPWVTPDQFWDRHVASNSVDAGDLKISWMYAHRRDGEQSIFDIHYLVGTHEGVDHFTERHEMGLFTHAQYMEAFRAAGLEVEHEEGGPFGRGLYVGRLPTDAVSGVSEAGGVSVGEERP